MGKTEAQREFFAEEKLYYTIGEASRIVGVKPFVLRYWETEFPAVRPQKSRANRRLYRRADIERLLAIRHLLYEKKFTIPGARRHMAEQERGAQMDLSFLKSTREELEAEVKKGLREIMDILQKKGG
jgi:DNA-binding transcriptional MerR regulator